MKAQAILVWLSYLLFLPLIQGYEVRIVVLDDRGQPVKDANATIAFLEYAQGSGEEFRGITSNDGEFRASGNAEHSVFVVADKAGHYEARLQLEKDQDHFIEVVIPRVIHPIPLDARRVIPKFPVQKKWLGFDFEVADWVAPYGKGQSEDILFHFKHEFSGYQNSIEDLEETIAFSKKAFAARKEEWTEEKFKLRAGKWNAVMKIAFPGEKEGMHEETNFLEYSRMKLPHKAPEEGYVPTWRYTDNTYSPATAREEVGFFLRNRVKLDAQGNIVSANYAKVMGDFHLDARGYVAFCYYFNPTPNDRNLEFDPARNLLPDDVPGSTVHYP